MSSVITVSNWSSVISSLDDVPAHFRTEVRTHAPDAQYMVYTPPDNTSSLRADWDTLVCLFNDRVWICECRHRNTLWSTTHLFNEIHFIERGTVLLYSWLTLDSTQGRTELLFNTVCEPLFQPIVRAIRLGAVCRDPYVLPDETIRETGQFFDDLNRVNYKFMNLGKASLLPGQRVLQRAFQPEWALRTIRIFQRVLWAKFLTPRMIVMTDEELILIQETQDTKTSLEPLYGGKFMYAPLNCIRSLTAEQARFRGCTRLTLHFDNGASYPFVCLTDQPDFQRLTKLFPTEPPSPER